MYIEAEDVILRDYQPSDYESVCTLLIDLEIKNQATRR